MASKDSYMTINVTGVSELLPANKKDKEPTDEDYEKVGEMLGKALRKTRNEIIHKTDVAALKFASHEFKYVKQFATSAMKNGWNRYTTLQEDYIAENTFNNLKMSFNKVSSLNSAIYQGGMVGAAFGPAGAIAGGLVSAVGWAINNEMENRQKLSGYYQQLNQTNFQTYLDSSRAGLVDNGRGTQN